LTVRAEPLCSVPLAFGAPIRPLEGVLERHLQCVHPWVFRAMSHISNAGATVRLIALADRIELWPIDKQRRI